MKIKLTALALLSAGALTALAMTPEPMGEQKLLAPADIKWGPGPASLPLGAEAADVKIHVFTQSGRSIYTNVVRDLSPGYHQIAWDGRDAEGDDLANGVYFFRMSITTPSGATRQELGRLVKLRRPRRVEEPTVP